MNFHLKVDLRVILTAYEFDMMKEVAMTSFRPTLSDTIAVLHLTYSILRYKLGHA